MNLYRYTAILSKTMLVQGKITYIDKRASRGMLDVPLDSQLVQGYIAARYAIDAEKAALEQLKRIYPTEQGYANHENVTVRYVEEQTV